MKRVWLKIAAGLIGAVILLSACAKNAPTVSGEADILGAYPEMKSAEFWLANVDAPDKEIMTPDRIAELNANIAKTEGTDCVDLSSYRQSVPRDELLSLLRLYEKPTEPRYIGSRELNDRYYQKLFKNRNEKAVSDNNPISYGVITRYTELRTWPTDDVSYDIPNDVEFDLACETCLKTCERVVVLHTSEDGKWMLVQSYNYLGWVKAKDIATTSRSNWLALGENKDWLVITGNHITLDHNNSTPFISRLELNMGTKLPLVLNKPESIDGIATADSYAVNVPVRNSHGELELVLARVPYSADVSVGFLTYTRRNLLNQSFKLLGERYSFGGKWGHRDCSSMCMDIFGCFGIELPRNTGAQKKIPTNSIDVSQSGDSEKLSLIMRQSPGTLLQMPGHIMLYLGSFNGSPYIMHASGGTMLLPQGGELCALDIIVSTMDICKKNGSPYWKNISTVIPME